MLFNREDSGSYMNMFKAFSLLGVVVITLGTIPSVSAQVTVSGGNVSVNTGEGTAVNVDGGAVSVKSPKGGQTAVAVGKGRTAVNVGSGNVVSNTAGTVESGSVEPSTDKPKRSGKGGKQGKDGDDFWGEKGFWGEDGEPGEQKSRKKNK